MQIHVRARPGPVVPWVKGAAFLSPAAAGPEGFQEEEPPLTGGRQNCVARPSRTPWNGRSSEGVAFADTNKSASCLKERHVAHCDPEGTA